MENWLSNDIQEEWTYLSAVYCKDIHPDLKDHCQSCSQCTTFIIQGEEELKAKLLKIEKMVPRLGFMTKADRGDFKTFLKYLLFLMPRKALPIGANYTKQFREAVEKAGDIENIKNIAFPTNAQRLLKENYMKAIMFGPWGSGKTLWMTDKAIKLAKKGHKVAFAVFVKHKIKTKPMLFIDLQHKLKDYENIEVVLIPLNYQKSNNLVDITNDAKYFLGDEFPDNLGGFKKQVKDEFIEFITSRDFAWLTLINSSFKDLHDEDDFKSTVEKWKPIGFEIIEMETPMRMPSRLAEGLKKHLNPNDFYSHGLFVNSKLPPNITEGSDVTIINEDLSADRMISECFKHIRHKADNIGVLFIVGGVETSWIESLLNCQCKNKIKPILMDYLLEKEERKPPIFHLNDYSSGEQAVLNWMINAEKSQDAFVQHELAKGTERPVVVVFDGSQRSKEFISRSNGIAVLCKMDWKLAMSILVGVILGDRSHHCESILDRNSSRPQINFDIGNLNFQRFYFVLIEFFPRFNPCLKRTEKVKVSRKWTNISQRSSQSYLDSNFRPNSNGFRVEKRESRCVQTFNLGL